MSFLVLLNSTKDTRHIANGVETSSLGQNLVDSNINVNVYLVIVKIIQVLNRNILNRYDNLGDFIKNVNNLGLTDDVIFLSKIFKFEHCIENINLTIEIEIIS